MLEKNNLIFIYGKAGNYKSSIGVSLLNSTDKKACYINLDNNNHFKINDNIKVRARSNTINVSNILNKFNGGGHKYAAGALIYGDNIYNISNKVINEIKNYKEI